MCLSPEKASFSKQLERELLVWGEGILEVDQKSEERLVLFVIRTPDLEFRYITANYLKDDYST